MATPKKPKKSNAQPHAPANRPHFSPKPKSAAKNGNKPAAQSPGPAAPATFHFLEELQPITLLQMEVYAPKSNHSYSKLMRLFQHPCNQLQALNDVYAMVKAQPCYKNLKDPNWKTTDSPLTLIAYYLRKLGRLTKGAYWSLDTVPAKPGAPISFRFVALKYYHSQHVTPRVYNTSLEFLPKIAKADKHLHDLILMTVAFISKNANVPLWDADGDYSLQIEKLPRLNTLEKGTDLYLQTSIYRSYPAANYLHLLKSMRRDVTEEMIIKQMQSWPAKWTERKRRIIEWVKMALQVKGNLANTTYVPNYVSSSEQVIFYPQNHFKFVWSNHPRDLVQQKVHHVWQKHCPEYLPVNFSILKPGQVFKPVGEDKFPLQLTDLFKYGEWIFRRAHGQYFFGGQTERESLTQITLRKTTGTAKPDTRLLINNPALTL